MSSAIGFATESLSAKQMNTQDLQSTGLAAQQRLESQKLTPVFHSLDQCEDMKASADGWLASNPTASLHDFAEQEAGKVNLSSADIEAMVHAVTPKSE